MKRAKSFMIFSLIFILHLVGTLPGWAAVQVSGGVQVNVPPQGVTELNLKTEVCVYRGYTGAPVEVIVETPKLRLTALQISYDQKQQLITAEGTVKCEAEQLVATGETMIISPKEMRLPKGGVITKPETEPVKIVGTGELSYQFSEEVVRGVGGFSFLGTEWKLDGEHFTGDFQKGLLTASGQLRFRHHEIQAEAGTLSYHQKEERIILSESPLIRWEEGVLRGENDTVIIYDLAIEKAKVEGPTKTRFYQDGGVYPSGD